MRGLTHCPGPPQKNAKRMYSYISRLGATGLDIPGSPYAPRKQPALNYLARREEGYHLKLN